MKFRKIFALPTALLWLAFAHAETSDSFENKCNALKQRLSQIDCPTAMREIASFIGANHKIIREHNPQDPKSLKSMTSFLDAALEGSSTLQDCLAKSRDNASFNSLVEAHIQLNSANFEVEQMLEEPEHTTDFLKRLATEDYQEAEAALKVYLDEVSD